MIKPYKEKDPISTIQKIRSILNDLGIFVKESYRKNGDFHVCRIEIANENLIKYNIGTNGKGRSIEYCYASGYAEFMERIQNNLLIPKSFYFSKLLQSHSSFKKQLQNDNLILDFLYDPDEKKITTEELLVENEDFFKETLFIHDTQKLRQFLIDDLGFVDNLCVPFYNKTDNKLCFLPHTLLMIGYGSNGMCAGNTPEEAMIQGMGEILERYVMKEIYVKKLSPPTIPHDYFSNYAIFDSIKKIEERGFDITIKDFSLGKGLPVIGVIIVDKKTNTYNVKIGSDPWPIIALERCLTELHQSFRGVRLIPRKGFGTFIDFNSEYRSEQELINFRKIFTNATGHWPDSIFNESFSYKFKGLNFSLGISNKLDLEYMTNTIENLGSKLYIRDVSYLGFNAYHIIAPGLSQLKRDKYDYFFYCELTAQIKNINKVCHLNKKDLLEHVQVLEKKYDSLKVEHINYKEEFLFNTDKDAMDLNIDLYFAMVFYKLEDYSKAYEYLAKYLVDKDSAIFIYYFACKDYIALKDMQKDINEIYHLLSKVYEKNLVEEVIADMLEPNNIFQYFNYDSYFDSDNCEMNNFDFYPMARILKKIQETHKANPISQLSLSSFFSKGN